jgi:hypothetical protein
MRLFILLLLCAACAPQVPLHQSNPLEPEPITVAESPDVTINLQHLGTQFNHLVFDLEITNHSPDTVWFRPQQISYYASRKMFPAPANASEIHTASYNNSRLLAKRIFATSPDQVLQVAEDRAKSMRVLAGVAVLSLSNHQY